MRKTWFCVLMIPLLLLNACQLSDGGAAGTEQTAQEAARALRTQYQTAERCHGTVDVTADYGLRAYEFTLDFDWQREGETVLTLTAPEELAGLTARIGAGESRLEFDGVSLGTGDLTGEGLTPMELIPATMGYIAEGYMAEFVFEQLEETPAVRVLYRDPERGAGEGVECVQWFDRATGALLHTELSYDGLLVLTGTFTDFYLGDEMSDGNEQEPDMGGDQTGSSGA